MTDSHILWVASSVVMPLAVPFQRCRYYYCCCCCYGDWLPGGVDSEVGCYSRLPRDVLRLRPRTPPAPRPEVPQSAKLVLVLPQSVRNANKQNKEDKFRNCPVGQRTLSVAHKVNSISFYIELLVDIKNQHIHVQWWIVTQSSEPNPRYYIQYIYITISLSLSLFKKI